jgi:hypothetical protein
MENLESSIDEGTWRTIGLGIGVGVSYLIIALTNSGMPSALELYSEFSQLYQDFANSPGFGAFMP